jgi:hypothetical protein
MASVQALVWGFSGHAPVRANTRVALSSKHSRRSSASVSRKIRQPLHETSLKHQRHCILSGHFRMEMSCLVAEKSLAALLGALESTKNSNIWTGLWRCATKGAPSSPQSNSAKQGSKTLHRESMFQNANELLHFECFGKQPKLEDQDWSLVMRHQRGTIISTIRFCKTWIKDIAL